MAANLLALIVKIFFRKLVQSTNANKMIYDLKSWAEIKLVEKIWQKFHWNCNDDDGRKRSAIPRPCCADRTRTWTRKKHETNNFSTNMIAYYTLRHTSTFISSSLHYVASKTGQNVSFKMIFWYQCFFKTVPIRTMSFQRKIAWTQFEWFLKSIAKSF